MERTKTAFIITKLELGGAQKSVLYTAEHLDKKHFESYLLTGMGGYFDDCAKEHIDHVHFINHLQRSISPIKDFIATFEILLTLAKIKPDIVHTNSSKAGILGRFAAMLLRKPKIVHTVHGFGFNDTQNFLVRNFYIFLERFFAKRSDLIIFVSEDNLNSALKLKIAPREKCQLIRAGVELKTKKDFKDFSRADKLKELGLPQDSKIVLSIANLKPQKNPLDMVRAAKAVCAKMPEAVFLYLGTGELEHKTKALIHKYKLENNFKLMGHRDDVPQLLAIADAFSLTSLWEGLPMALAEALSMQVPAACYDCNGVREILRDGRNGFLIPLHNYAMLAARLLNILEGNFTFDETSSNIKEFDIKTMLKEQENVYTMLGDK